MSDPVHISEVERAERAKINWPAVHLAADRRAPFALQHRLTKREIFGGKP